MQGEARVSLDQFKPTPHDLRRIHHLHSPQRRTRPPPVPCHKPSRHPQVRHVASPFSWWQQRSSRWLEASALIMITIIRKQRPVLPGELLPPVPPAHKKPAPQLPRF